MFLRLYEIYRQFAFDSILSFMLLMTCLFYLCGCKHKKNKLLTEVLYFTLSFAIYTFLYMLFLTKYSAYIYWYYFVLLIIVSIPFTCIFLSKSFLTKTIYIFFFVAIVQMFKLVCVPLYDHEQNMDKMLYAQLDLLASGIMYILIILFTRFLKHLNLSPNIKHSIVKPIVFLYFPISILVGFIINIAFVPGPYQISVLALIILSNVPLICYIFSMLITSYEEQRNLDMALTLSKAELNSYKTSVLHQEQIKKERHELKNKYFYLETLLKTENYSKAEEFIKQTIGDFDLNNSYIDTGNKFLDYLLNKKIMESNSYGINTVTQVYLKQNLNLDELSLCTIISNLIDNAFDYCNKNPDYKEIHIEISTNQSYLIFIIKNKIDNNLVLDTDNLLTTKQDKANHGIGLKVVKATVKKCNGISSFSVDNGFFIAKVMIPINGN